MHKEDFMRFLGTYGISVFRFDGLSELEEGFANAWGGPQPHPSHSSSPLFRITKRQSIRMAVRTPWQPIPLAY